MGDAKATLTIRADAQGVPYDRMIFGGFLEHFDSQVYGGVFEPGSPLADEKGFRLDVMDALRELKVPVVRWPGGCFVDSYHWRKGVGRDREAYGDFRWGVIEPNTFGTHEFVELCRRLGAEPYICTNGLTGAEENLDWVKYCNAAEGEMARLRAADGHPEPLGVKYWSVGNERSDRAYVHRVRDTARAMKEFDPELRIMCSGTHGGLKANVAEYLLEEAGPYLDLLSIHNYWLDRGPVLPRYDYMTAITKSELPEAYVSGAIGSLNESGGGDHLKIAFDEWNLRAWQHPGFPRDKVEDYDDPQVRKLVEQRVRENDLAEQYTMADALFSASFLNSCLRHSGRVVMANVAPLVNTRGPLYVHPEGIVRRTHFHAMAMYANLLEGRVVNTEIASDKLEHEGNAVATVDAIATVDDSGKRHALALVNRHPSEDVTCEIRIGGRPLDGACDATVLAGDSPDAYNDIEHPDRVAPVKTRLEFANGSVDLPPHSLTVVNVSTT